MNPNKQSPLRKIAETVLTKHLGNLDVAVKGKFATSLVRQWVTNDGYAGFAFPTRQFWFQMVKKGDGVEVGCSPVEGNWGRSCPRTGTSTRRRFRACSIGSTCASPSCAAPPTA